MTTNSFIAPIIGENNGVRQQMDEPHSLPAMLPYINVKLALLGCQTVVGEDGNPLSELISSLIAQYREKERLLGKHLPPVDERIQTFLFDYLQDVPVAP